MVVIMCVSLSVRLSLHLYFQVTFLHNAWKLSAETCLASRTCNSLEKMLNLDFRFKVLLSTYGVMMLTSTAIQGPAKNKSPQQALT